MFGGRHEDVKLHSSQRPNAIVLTLQKIQSRSQNGSNTLVFTINLTKTMQHTVNVAGRMLCNQTTKSNPIPDRNEQRVYNALGG